MSIRLDVFPIKNNWKLRAHTSDSSYLICLSEYCLLSLKPPIKPEKVELATQEFPAPPHLSDRKIGLMDATQNSGLPRWLVKMQFHSKAVWQSHPSTTIAHTFQSLNVSSMYRFQLPWYFQIHTDHRKYRSLLWFQFFHFILDDPIFPCHFPKVFLHRLASSMLLTAKGWKGHTSQPLA